MSRCEPRPRKAGGLYAIMLMLRRRTAVRAGALDPVSFEPGMYLYIGSAIRALGARLARHKSASKKLRWHIDYFRRRAVWKGAFVFPLDIGECRLAVVAARGAGGAPAAAGFGASDCRCPGHLISAGGDEGAVRRALLAAGGRPWVEGMEDGLC